MDGTPSSSVSIAPLGLRWHETSLAEGVASMLWMAAVAAVASATSVPVQLSCQIGQGQAQRAAELNLDEANQRVTLTRLSQAPAALPAVFGPGEVKFGEKIGRETMFWTINRVDLSLRQTVTFSDHVETGVCRIEKPVANRAF